MRAPTGTRRRAARPSGAEFRAPPPFGQGTTRRRTRSARRAVARSHYPEEILEELVRHLARRSVDQARADLRQLAADLGLDAIAQDGLAAVLLERHGGAALGEAGDAAGALAADLVAGGRIEVGQGDLAIEGRLDRADLGDDPCGEFVLRALVHGLRAGDAGFQGFRVVELFPDRLARSRDAHLAVHFHSGSSSTVACVSRE